MLARFVLPTILAAALWGLAYSVPFDTASYGAWTGIVLVLLSLAALVRPSRWLWLPSRARAGFALGTGVAITSVVLIWPVSLDRIAQPQTRLDEFLPEYQAVEYHEAFTRAPLARVVEAIRQVSLADMPVAAFLLRLRTLAPSPIGSHLSESTPLLDMILASGFFLALDTEDSRDQVFGMVGKPWENSAPQVIRSAGDFVAFHDSNNVRVAFDFRVGDAGGGRVRVSTETRIMGTDVKSQRLFQRYWRMIYPGSAIIRRVWLNAIVARAERPQP